MFLIIFLDGVALLVLVVGIFIVLLATFECCRPTGKSKRCLWVHKYMRVCVEYITFNAFLRWFHEFSLTFFISCLFNMRIDPSYRLHWANIISYIICFFFLIVVGLYIAWISYYFHRTRRPATLDLPVNAIKKREEGEFSHMNMGDTQDNFGGKVKGKEFDVSSIDKTGMTAQTMYADEDGPTGKTRSAIQDFKKKSK